jgi:hypothetical protein
VDFEALAGDDHAFHTEAALAVVLVAGAGLTLRSLW